jgi:hypothetical protein
MDPKAITDTCTEQYGFKLKGTGLIDYHLGMTFAEMVAKTFAKPLSIT